MKYNTYRKNFTDWKQSYLHPLTDDFIYLFYFILLLPKYFTLVSEYLSGTVIRSTFNQFLHPPILSLFIPYCFLARIEPTNLEANLLSGQYVKSMKIALKFLIISTTLSPGWTGHLFYSWLLSILISFFFFKIVNFIFWWRLAVQDTQEPASCGFF